MRKRVLIWSVVTAGLLAGGVAAYFGLVQMNSQKAVNASSGEYTDEELAAARKKLPIKQTIAPVSKSSAKPLDLSPDNPIRFAVGSLGFTNDEQNGRVGDLIVAELSGVKGLTMVERRDLQKILHELDLSLSGLVRAKDAVRVGKLLKADWFLLGTPAIIKGTNSLVIRVVDGRTGVLCDVRIFASDTGAQELAAKIAAFARQTRQNAANNRIAEFVAIGAFDDLGVNNRLAGFPAQLRGYLISAYQSKNVTLLERDSVDTLLHEVYLDLAGLTEDSAANVSSTMQSAYWLINGSYQSYETTNFQIEMILDVDRVFGLPKQVILRGLPGEPFCQQIKQAIDSIMSQDSRRVIPLRRTEIAAQLSIGEKIMCPGCSSSSDDFMVDAPEDHDQRYFDSFTGLPLEGADKRKRNVEEAIKVFETVLLLDHDNREAKMHLAACFRSPLIDRVKEARHLYRQVIEAEAPDRWTSRAEWALQTSFRFTWRHPYDPFEQSRWFKAAAETTTLQRARDYYSKHAESAEAAAKIAKEDTTTVTPETEQRMFEKFQRFENELHKNRPVDSDIGIFMFVRSFGTNHDVGAQHLLALLPKVKKQFPDVVPHYLAAIVYNGSDSNAPVIGEFLQEIKRLREHVDQLPRPDVFWTPMDADRLCEWGFSHKRFDVVAQLMELALQHAAIAPPKSYFDEPKTKQVKVTLGYAYEGMEQWQRALDVFQSLTNDAVTMDGPGPWGRGHHPVLTSAHVEFCASKLGRSVARDPREFEMDPDCFCLCSDNPTAVAVGEDGIWVAINNQLLKTGFDLKTNLAVALPREIEANISCLCLSPSTVWIGTDGSGLLEYDKASGKFHRFTAKDGMLMNTLSCLDVDGSALWIGYGHRTYRVWASARGTGEGGLGRLDLSTQQFESFTPSLQTLNGPGTETADQPCHRPIITLSHGPEDDVWCLVEGMYGTVLRNFRKRENKWSTAEKQIAFSSLARDSRQLYVGTYRSDQSGPYEYLGVSRFDLKTSTWGNLTAIGGLPRGQVSALAPDHGKLWVGGKSFIALVDLEQDKVVKFTRFPSQVVNQIDVAGGYLWAVYDSHLHRVLLHTLQ